MTIECLPLDDDDVDGRDECDDKEEECDRDDEEEDLVDVEEEGQVELEGRAKRTMRGGEEDWWTTVGVFDVRAIARGMMQEYRVAMDVDLCIGCKVLR